MKKITQNLTVRRLASAMAFAGLFTPAWSAPITFPTTPLSVTSAFSPNVLLDLSVEFPTVGTAYNGSRFGIKTSPVDAGVNIDFYFDPALEYVGYWRSDRCYTYLEAGNRFDEAAATTTMACGTGAAGRWSGNFLNWAQTSAIDVLRATLNGGYRSVDTDSLTVLQRAYLNGNVLGSAIALPIKEVGIGYNTLNAPGRSVDPRLFTPFDVDRLRITSTAFGFFFRGWNGTVEQQLRPVNGDGIRRSLEYSAQVKVCDSAFGAVASNCKTYGNGTSIKPVGEIQLRGNTLRFGAFGYLIDSAPQQRDGAVLRASLRSVAPTTKISGATAANPQREWDEATGIFVVNPDSSTVEANSGVINYLNKFGRTSGYKTYDAVGELYSESLRYLMGKQPKAESLAGEDSVTRDGFPIATTWTDPIEGACQKNNIIVIGDANTWCDGRVPGGQENNTGTCGNRSYPAETANGLTLNASTWMNHIGLAEARGTLSTARTGAGDSATFSISGLAYFARVNNIRPDLNVGSVSADVKVKTFVIDVDEAGGVAYNRRQYWYAAKYGGFDDVPTAANLADANYRPLPDTGEWEAPSLIPGNVVQPKTYFLASNGLALQNSLRSAFATIASEGASNPKLAASAGRITSTDEGIFSTTMDTASWTGDLIRKDVSFSGNTITVGNTPKWNAAIKLTGSTSAPVVTAKLPSGRNIVTYASGAPVDFTWSAIPADYKTLLQAPYVGQSAAQSATEGERRLEWLRGVRTAETVAVDPLRKRVNLLGDAASNSPLYVGAPGGDGYADLDYAIWAAASARKNRTKMVYVGSSDGMLHGFDASSSTAGGQEVLAYVPSRLMKKFASSADPKYERKPMVEATPVAVDVKFGPVSGTDWRTLLVGGLGGGGKGVYALDVTDPSSFGTTSKVWEFTENDDADLGHITTAPLVTRLADGKFVVMFGSGYNNTVAASTGDPASTTGKGFLYVLLADKGGAGTWTEGSNFKKIALGTTGSPTTPAGVANPNASRDAAGFANRVYLGDLDGQMWRVNVPPVVSGVVRMSDWSSSATKMFTASVGGTPQPITTTPALVFNPKGGIVVLFGTGKFIEATDRKPSLPVANSFYGVFDSFSGSSGLDPSKLNAISLSTSAGKRTVSAGPPSTPAKTDGWYVNLVTSGNNQGEMVIFPPNVSLGTVDFTTQLGATTCDAGSGYFMSLDPITGLAGTPTIDVNGDGVLNASDSFAGLATKTPPGQVTIVRLSRPSDPYAAVSYIRSFGADLLNAVGSGGITGADKLGIGSKAGSRFGRLNYRQINEIKR
jgi:type IV pilus assembly protein PilY1